jgi:hypothetical protein
MQLTDKQRDVMAAAGHLLVTGGPGSGKTTVSTLKAAQIAERELRPGQKILFLSFARATVSRVIEAIEHEQQIPREQKRRIDVETYHSFFWRILKAHGYLLGPPRRLSILTPPTEAIALSTIRSGYAAEAKLTDEQSAEKKQREQTERNRLAREEGRLCFDLFAPSLADILHGSVRIQRLITAMYPVKTRTPSSGAPFRRSASLARLRGLEGSGSSKPLMYQWSRYKGLHYTAAQAMGAEAVIFGGGCSGRTSLSSASSSLRSLSGSV